MQVTLTIELGNGVKLSKSAHVESLKDLARFFGQAQHYTRAVLKLVPEFAGVKVAKTQLSVE